MRNRMFGLLAALLLVLLPVSAFAQDEETSFESIYDIGNMTFSVAAGLPWIYGIGIGVYPGLELIVGQVMIADTLPLDFGIAARGYFATSFGGYWTSFGGGAFGTVHLTFRDFEDLPISYLDNMDFYIGIGLFADVITTTNDWWLGTNPYATPFSLGIAATGGANYWLNDSLGIILEGSYLGRTSSTLIGLVFKV